MIIKPKVLLIQESLSHYRQPIYEIIAKSVDLTLGYTHNNQINNSSINTIKLKYVKFGRIYYHINLLEICNRYDVVIFLPHLKFIRLLLLPLLRVKFKKICWSIGVMASYNYNFNIVDKPRGPYGLIYKYFIFKTDAFIFYMKETLEFWTKHTRIDRNKLFVAHNTVAINKFDRLPDFCQRDSILFIGTLYKEKGVLGLLDAYKRAFLINSNVPNLIIIGDGPEREKINMFISDNSLNGKVEVLGSLYDENSLQKYFFKSLVCISPSQAGLSVLKSMGYGTPFVTKYDSITGGERLNIMNGFNGLVYHHDYELVNIVANIDKYFSTLKIMSINARNYYLNFCLPEKMASGVVDAIEYVIKNDKKFETCHFE